MALPLSQQRAMGPAGRANAQQRRAAPSKGRAGPVIRQPDVTVRLLGGDGGPSSDKKFITREEEPEQYWSSKGEREGKAVMSDPLAILGVFAIFFPFIFLGIAIALGYIDLSVYK